MAAKQKYTEEELKAFSLAGKIMGRASGKKGMSERGKKGSEARWGKKK